MTRKQWKKLRSNMKGNFLMLENFPSHRFENGCTNGTKVSPAMDIGYQHYTMRSSVIIEEPIYFPLRRVHLCECRRLIDGGTQQYQEINIQEPTERKAPRDNSIHDEIAVQETEVPSTADDDDVKEKFTSSDEAVMQTVSSEDAERYLVSQILKSLSGMIMVRAL